VGGRSRKLCATAGKNSRDQEDDWQGGDGELGQQGAEIITRVGERGEIAKPKPFSWLIIGKKLGEYWSKNGLEEGA